MRSILVTGSSGLIGSEAVLHFERRGFRVVGVDNNMRADFFGPDGDTTWNLQRLQRLTTNFVAQAIDIRDRSRIDELIRELRPAAIIHCAAQPSHDLAAERPFDDFEVNAGATLNLLEATRRWCKDAPFVFMSTNKVYGDAPNEIPLHETATRYVYADGKYEHGIDETCRVDRSLHSLFGASKLAADILTQEYGRYFGMPTVCFRGGCLTGPSQSGVQLHGFLAYGVKAIVAGQPYTVFGYKGKQVRDQIHSCDVVSAMEEFINAPRAAEVYNIGGGTANSLSILELFDLVKEKSGHEAQWTYRETARRGDHMCYISDIRKFSQHYPRWTITRSLGDIVSELIAAHSDSSRSTAALPRN